MNADERSTGQEGYGRQDLEQSSSRQPAAQSQQPDTMNQGRQSGAPATGQASYGNSGETDLSQDDSSLGQEADLGQSGGTTGKDSLISGSDSDTDEQDFASQGQGALEQHPETIGTDDIAVERSNQGNSL